jgi:hypothetical protein
MNTNLIKIIGGLALVLAATTATAQETWYFYQAGWSNGGTVSGSFTGTDLNSDGQLASFDGEVANFNVSMTGSSIIPDGFTWDQSRLWGLVYDINGGPFLGDGLTGAVEGFAVWDNNYNYYSGYGPNGTPGGGLYGPGNVTLDSTLDPIMVSTTPITDVIYQDNLGSYDFPSPTPTPEPSTLALSAMGGLGGLLLFRRRK